MVGETTIAEAKRHNWPRRIARVFLFTTNNQLLLQRRASHVVSFPDLWDQSAGGHVDVGETEREAAIRELKEELGITNVPLTTIAEGVRSDQPDDYVFSYIYRGIVSPTTSLAPDPDEVSTVRWFTLEEFESAVWNTSAQFVPTFVALYRRYRDTLTP